MGKMPYIRFFVGDWRQDPALRACSLGARGMWLEMLLLMAQSNRKGYLEVGGIAPSPKKLVPLVGASSVRQCLSLLRELEENKVFSRDEQGVIYSRRMLRDIEDERQKREYGLRGGNKMLMTQVNQEVKLGVKGEVKDTDNHAPFPKNIPSYSSSDSVPLSNPIVKMIIDWWSEEYLKRFNQKYLVTGKDAAIVKRLLNTLDEIAFKQYAKKFLDSEDEFVKKAGYTIGIFWSQINKLTSGGKRSGKPGEHDQADRAKKYREIEKSVDM